jgi:hypothetical protein
MKLDLLHETTLVGAVAMRPNILGTPEGGAEVSLPSGSRRWYLTFSHESPVFDLMEAGQESGTKVKTQFGSQTSRPKKLVWQPEEGQGHELTNKSLYVPPGTKKAKPYRWPRTTFHGQSEGHKEHILK